MRPKTRLVVVVVALSLLAAGLVLFLALYPVWTTYREYQNLTKKSIKEAVEELKEPAPQPEPSSPGNVKRDDAKPDGAKRDR
jgi:hypothetical protein